MDEVINLGVDDDNEELDEFVCQGCGCTTSEADFDSIDDELTPNHPLCPDCQANQRIQNGACEDCGEPATHEVDHGLLCDDCHDNYADGYLRDD